MWHDTFPILQRFVEINSVTWLIRMRDKTHLYVWHDSSICVTWRFYMCDRGSAPFSNTWTICGGTRCAFAWRHTSGTTKYTGVLLFLSFSQKKYMWTSRVKYLNKSCHIYDWVMLYVWMSHVTHMNESCQTCERVMFHDTTHTQMHTHTHTHSLKIDVVWGGYD